VREALRRLQQLGLVKVSQGGATRVLDWRANAGLDLAMALASAGDVLPVATLERDVLEMRACIGADAARLCAQRAARAARESIADAVDEYAAAVPDLVRMEAADLAFWRRVVESSGNITYLLAFNSLTAGTLAVGHVPLRHRTAELLDVAAHRKVSGLIAGDAAAGPRRADHDDVRRRARPDRDRSLPEPPRPPPGRCGVLYLDLLCIVVLGIKGRAPMRVTKDLVAASATPIVLGILAEGESYGYAILRRISDLSGGELDWTEGFLYPLLHRLERLGHVESSWQAVTGERRRKYYRITRQGIAELSEQHRQWETVVDALKQVWPSVGDIRPLIIPLGGNA
jgi:DNA-binding FadR family transcriptional regulator/DNA-binding PadR family transcriptional regulator